MFTNVRVRCDTDDVKLHFDPPLPRVRFIEFCPIMSSVEFPLLEKSKRMIEKAFFSIRCSIIDENKNYSDIDSPLVGKFTNEEETFSYQKRSKNHHSFLNGEFTKTMVAAKTDEFVSDFNIRIEDVFGKPYRKKLLSNPMYICVKLYH